MIEKQLKRLEIYKSDGLDTIFDMVITMQEELKRFGVEKQ